MKRYLIFTAVILSAVVALFNGCHKTSPSGVVDIRYWDFWITQGETINNEIRLFEAAHPDIHIIKTTVNTDHYSEVLILAKKTKRAPDVFLVPLKPSFQELAADKWFRPLNDLPGWTDFTKELPPHSLAEGYNVLGGKAYSVPFYGNFPFLQLWINTDVFRRAGLVDSRGRVLEPKTLDDVLKFSRQISRRSAGKVYGYGFSGKGGSASLFWNWYWAEASGLPLEWGGLNLKTGHYEYSKNPAFLKLLQALMTMKREGLLLPECLSIDSETARVAFAEGRIGMLTSGYWVVNGWQQTNPDFHDFTVVPLPLVGVTEPRSYFLRPPGGFCFALDPSTEHPKEAWLWMQWLQSRAAGKRWVQGGNGMSVWDAANRPEYVSHPALARLFKMTPLVKVGPQPAMRNLAVASLRLATVKPDEGNIIEGMLTGEITDLQGALVDLDRRKQAALEDAIADAKERGLKVSLDDFIFNDWDPTKDYYTRPRS